MGECQVRGCPSAAVVHLSVGYLGKPMRYTGISFCFPHASGRLNNSGHAVHLVREMEA